MKTLIAWLTGRQSCACGQFKLSRAAKCYDCTLAEQDAAFTARLADHADH